MQEFLSLFSLDKIGAEFQMLLHDPSKLITNFSDFLYTYILIILLVSVGLYFSFKTKFVQITLFKDGLKMLKNDNNTTGVSAFQSLMISTASRVGTGNIAGVATAITFGGPGSIFWMWLIAIIGSASAFVESTLAQVYKIKDGDSYRGGPAYYIKQALGKPKMGILFAVLLILCFVFGFNALQSFNIVDSLTTLMHIDGNNLLNTKFILGICVAVISGIVIFGGIHRIGVISSIVVPIMAAIYIGLGLVVIVQNFSALPAIFSSIFQAALSPQAFASGTMGAAIMYGVKRGLFSNEAGMGSSPNAAATSDVSHPVKQGLAQVISVFIDTILICSTTALFLLVYNNVNNLEGMALVQASFEAQFGKVGLLFITVAICLFAFTSIIGNYSYAESNFKFIIDSKKSLFIFRCCCLLPLVIGALYSLSLAWSIADILMGLMAIVNIIAIVKLAKVAFICLDDYKRQKQANLDPQFHPKQLGIENTSCWDQEEE